MNRKSEKAKRKSSLQGQLTTQISAYKLTADHKPEMWRYYALNVWRRVQYRDQQVGKAQIDDEVVGGTVKPSGFLDYGNHHCIAENRHDSNK